MNRKPARHAAPALLAAATLFGAASAQSLELEDCRIGAGPGYPSIKAHCGTMPRPLNPEDPDSPVIGIRVAVVAALDLNPEPDPVVPIAGGPGQGSVEFYLQTRAAFENLRRDRDILLVDQRGTGESARMDCDVDADIVLYQTDYSLDETVEFMRDCLDALPYDPRYFTTSVAVADLEAIREALGYPELNLYGVSYGSRVAQHFARRFPDSTRTVVVDGVLPPQIALGPEIATESQKAVDGVLARCAADPDCNERFPGIEDTFVRVVSELRAGPVEVTVPHPNTGRPETFSFGPGQFAGAVRLLVYDRNTIALLPLFIHEAGRGNFGPLASQFVMIAISMADALAIGMHNAVICTEDAPFLDRATIDLAAVTASYMGSFQLETLEAMCSVWPAGAIDADFKSPLASQLPFLLLSGDADPITPPRYAEMAAAGLGYATHLIGRHQGHGQITVGCTGRIVADFVATRDPFALDAECLERSFVTPFFLDFSGPAP